MQRVSAARAQSWEESIQVLTWSVPHCRTCAPAHRLCPHSQSKPCAPSQRLCCPHSPSGVIRTEDRTWQSPLSCHGFQVCLTRVLDLQALETAIAQEKNRAKEALEGEQMKAREVESRLTYQKKVSSSERES